MDRVDTPPLLQARALSYARANEPVFGPLDFSLDAGELALVEGDNGSGKTTLLRLLAGVLRVEDGELRWRGSAGRREQMAAELLFFGHQLGLNADLSARENLAVAIGLHGMRPDDAAQDIWDRIGLRGLEDEPVRRLSAGQKKRAALARLCALPATLWLLDEPYANLDRAGMALVDALLDTHRARGGAALVSSHGIAGVHRSDLRRIRL